MGRRDGEDERLTALVEGTESAQTPRNGISADGERDTA
jgi:hypothetical protein